MLVIIIIYSEDITRLQLRYERYENGYRKVKRNI